MFFQWLLRLIRRNKGVVYTVITGNYDDLMTPRFINDNWDYICFTDSEDLKSDFWKIKRIEDQDLDFARKSRKYKVLPHIYLSQYDYSLYIDGNFIINGDIDDYINEYSQNSPILCLIHPDRDCIYDEAEVCIKIKKDSPERIENQIAKYQSQEYPPHNGLIAGGILYRDHRNPLVIKVMEDWWDEIKSNSYRDQLSFNYVCWKNSLKYDQCDLSCWGNEYFERNPHNNLNSEV